MRAWIFPLLPLVLRGRPASGFVAKMSLSSGFGVSSLGSTAEAVSSAVSGARLPGGASPSIAFVSCTVDRDVEEVRGEFAKALPGCPLHGITSSGAVLTSGGAVANGVGCLLIGGEGKGDAPSFTTAGNMDGDATAAAKALVQALGNSKPRAIIMSTVPGREESALLEIASVFGGDVPIFGGTAADNELNGSWKVFTADGVSGTGISLVAVGPNVGMGASISGCYAETSKVGVATKSEGRVVHEIDGKPAADWVYDWLGEEVKEAYKNGGLILPQTAQRPISLKQASGEYINCHLAAFNGKGGVDFFTPIPEGSELLVMDSGDGPATGYAAHLADSYDMAKSNGSLVGPKAGLLIYCGGMAIAVGDKLDAGLQSDGFNKKVKGLPLMGLTVFGEQAYLTKAKRNVQCNLSMGMILFE